MSCDVTAHSPTLPLLHLRHSSFFNPSFASPTSQALHLIRLASRREWALLILQPFRHFTYVTTHSPTLPSLYLRHSSFSNPSFASPTSQALHLIHLASQQSSFSNLFVTSPASQLILQPFSRFIYFTAHTPTLQSIYLRHSSFFNPSVASPMSQFILQPFFRFFYVTVSSLTSPGKLPMI